MPHLIRRDREIGVHQASVRLRKRHGGLGIERCQTAFTGGDVELVYKTRAA